MPYISNAFGLMCTIHFSSVQLRTDADMILIFKSLHANDSESHSVCVAAYYFSYTIVMNLTLKLMSGPLQKYCVLQWFIKSSSSLYQLINFIGKNSFACHSFIHLTKPVANCLLFDAYLEIMVLGFYFLQNG